MQILRASSFRRMPWKNGGGETIEVAIAPQGAALEAFDWRISMAHVASAGPFSTFPAIDRTLAVIAGHGLTLHLAGRGAVRLDQDTAPYAFPGDLPVDATLVEGAIDDLNVMTRRGRFRHLLTRLHLHAPMALHQHGDVTVLLTRQAGAVLGDASLQPGDGAMLEASDPDSIELRPAGEGVFYAIDLWRL